MKNLQCYFVLSLACNLHCPHCIRKYLKENNSNSELSNKITKSQIEKIVNQFKKEKVKIIPILTGGEPTISNKYIEILKYLSFQFPKIYTCSNGVIAQKKLDKIIQYKNNVFQISLDGDAKTHNAIRGDKSFETAIRTINFLTKNNIEVCVSTTVNKQNISSIFNLADIISTLKITHWKISLEQNFVNEKENLLIEEWNCFVDKILKYAKVPVKIKKMFDFELFEKLEKKYGKEYLQNNATKNCGFAKSKMYIYPDLSVRGCTCIDDINFGNLNKNSVNEIMCNMKNFQDNLQISSESICATCKWLYLCNGGCPGYSYHYFGTLGMGDIRCPFIRGKSE